MALDPSNYAAREMDACDDLAEDTESPSSLLRRRRLLPLNVQTRGGSTSALASAMLAVTMRREITSLAPEEKIFDLYHWDEVLQEQGDGGKVVVCQAKTQRSPKSGSQGTSYVMKIRSKESLDRDLMTEQFRKSQLRMLNLPPHVGVLPIHDVLEDDKFYYIVMEKASGGAFFPALLTEFGDGVMPASAVRKVMREILEAIGHVHREGMLHRDVKPDNLVFQSFDDPMSPTGKAYKVALIDFDHAYPDWEATSPSLQASWCGTVRFSAPETFLGNFSQASDLYSVGVILYMLLAGRMPYDDRLFEDVLDRRPLSPGQRRFNWKGAIFQRMKEARIDWDCEPWSVQPLCRDFCQRLLSFDVGSRISSAEDAIEHPWFSSS